MVEFNFLALAFLEVVASSILGVASSIQGAASSIPEVASSVLEVASSAQVVASSAQVVALAFQAVLEVGPFAFRVFPLEVTLVVARKHLALVASLAAVTVLLRVLALVEH